MLVAKCFRDLDLAFQQSPGRRQVATAQGEAGQRVQGHAHLAGAALQLFNVLNGMMSARALQVATELGIADHLTERPRACDDLASRTGVRAPAALYRLLRFLASTGTFTEVTPGTF